MHITLSNNEYNAFGGHLNTAIVSATCEVILEELNGKLERSFDENTGLNLFKL
jgi:predicted DNA-binding protein with PD1-like motif